MAGLGSYGNLWDQQYSLSPSLDTMSSGFQNTANSFNGLSSSPQSSGSFLDSLGLGGSGQMSGLQMGNLALGGVTSLLNGYLGFQNLSLAKKQSNAAQDQWNTQWQANRKLTNSSLADRQSARVASNPNAYQSVDSYMEKYGI